MSVSLGYSTGCIGQGFGSWGSGAAGGVSVGGGQGCPMPGTVDSAMDPTQATAEPVSEAGGALGKKGRK